MTGGGGVAGGGGEGGTAQGPPQSPGQLPQSSPLSQTPLPQPPHVPQSCQQLEQFSPLDPSQIESPQTGPLLPQAPFVQTPSQRIRPAFLQPQGSLTLGTHWQSQVPSQL